MNNDDVETDPRHKIHKRSAVKSRMNCVPPKARVAGGVFKRLPLMLGPELSGGMDGCGASPPLHGYRGNTTSGLGFGGPIKGPPKIHVDDYDGQ